MSDELDRASMNAFIPPLQSAIRTGGDGGRVTLEVPETDMGEFVKLLAMRGKRLKLTVEVIAENGEKSQSNDRRIHI